jgi:hypothetical protein
VPLWRLFEDQRDSLSFAEIRDSNVTGPIGTALRLKSRNIGDADWRERNG